MLCKLKSANHVAGICEYFTLAQGLPCTNKSSALIYLVATMDSKLDLIPSVLLNCFVGVEDLENYHGKALGDKGKAAVEKLKEGLSNDKHNLGPQPVVDDAPSVDLSPGTIKLSEPPSYKIGDKVIFIKAIHF